MALGSYKNPAEFKDEDKWFKFFTKKQLVYIICGLGIGVVFFLLFRAIHLVVVGAILAVLSVIVAGVFGMGRIPDEKYLIGGGMSIETIVLRLILKRASRHVVYVKNYTSARLTSSDV